MRTVRTCSKLTKNVVVSNKKVEAAARTGKAREAAWMIRIKEREAAWTKAMTREATSVNVNESTKTP